MDLVDMANDLPTAAEHQVRKLRARLDELTARGDRWTEEGRKVSAALDVALVERAREDRS